MFLKSLELLNFKNYPEGHFQFHTGINCITGPNGSGKTNILDAIHYLSLCKSYFTSGDSQNILKDESFMMVKGTFQNDENKNEVVCSMKTGQKKQFRLNGKEYQRLADHIGKFPVVMITPTDHELITGGSDERRKFIDRIISQVSRTYLDNLNAYLRLLEQRNRLLRKTIKDKSDFETLAIYNEQLSSLSVSIYTERKLFCKELEKHFVRYYELITDGQEEASMCYESQLNEAEPIELLISSFEKDLAVQFTTTGIHKDDLSFSVDCMNVKRYGSQGQQKSVLIALKLSQFSFLGEHKGMKPIMVFDDLFDRLDDLRVERLILLVRQHRFGQMFITHTARERLDTILRNAGIESSFYEIRAGIPLLKV
ncbi:MAG: DNA replication and repair protein RecF [Bacteroidia bacterium]|nr:DNA replication and repair protein RecF [Bacteroidia bacterium]MCZ2277074.1 DNA replication and repair protein RecF [Bacteroidia bacterium]